MDDHNLIHEAIRSIIDENSPKQLQEQLKGFHPSDIAEVFDTLDDNQKEYVLHTLNHHMLADIFEHLDDEDSADMFKMLAAEKGARVLDSMDPDDAVDMLNEMDDKTQAPYLKLLEDDTREELEALKNYDEDTAGALMTTDYVELKKGMDVKDAMKALINNAKTTEGIQRLFVVDDHDFLEGVIELKHLIQARAPKSIDDIMSTDIVTANVNDDVEDVARLIQNYGIYLLPVVNDKNQLQGVITMDDAADVLDEATDEDYARFAAISNDDEVNRSILRSAFHRLPWLVVLLFLGLIISTIISSFEDTIAAITVLVFFQPLILDMAGNTGTQSLAVTVRGISKDYFDEKGVSAKHVFKELRVGLLNGIAIGALSFVTTLVFLTILGYDLHAPIRVAITVGSSAAISLSLASAFGAFFPLFLYKIKVDPAVASGPFITTMNDIIGLFIYFSLAALIILGGVL